MCRVAAEMQSKQVTWVNTQAQTSARPILWAFQSLLNLYVSGLSQHLRILQTTENIHTKNQKYSFTQLHICQHFDKST